MDTGRRYSPYIIRAGCVTVRPLPQMLMDAVLLLEGDWLGLADSEQEVEDMWPGIVVEVLSHGERRRWLRTVVIFLHHLYSGLVAPGGAAGLTLSPDVFRQAVRLGPMMGAMRNIIALSPRTRRLMESMRNCWITCAEE